jgi:23S rRNA (uridine2552-2'-O)-methyltransferase
MQRHVNDFYVKSSIKEGFRSRSAFKLIQIDKKLKIFNNVRLAVDLGASPGGWTQVMTRKGLKVVSVDILDMSPVTGASFLKVDMRLQQSLELIKKEAQGPAQLVVSDMCPNRSGDLQADALDIIELNHMAFQLSQEILDYHGKLVMKMLMCEEEKEFYVNFI